MSLEAQLEAAEESLAAAQDEALRLRRLLAAEQRGGADAPAAVTRLDGATCNAADVVACVDIPPLPRCAPWLG